MTDRNARHITVAKQVDYDRRTDIIDGRLYRQLDTDTLSMLKRGPIEIIEPVQGWHPYTHLVLCEERDLEGHYLVRFEDESTKGTER
jgi:hypothetical protein